MATIRSNAAQLANRNRARSVRIAFAARRSLDSMRGPITLSARAVSSGAVKQAAFDGPLSKSVNGNHPYGWGTTNWRGARGSVPYGDAGIINDQSGELKAGWESSIAATKKSAMLVIFNTTDHSKLIKWSNDNPSSSKMRYRPVLEDIHKLCDNGFSVRIRAAFQAAYKANP